MSSNTIAQRAANIPIIAMMLLPSNGCSKLMMVVLYAISAIARIMSTAVTVLFIVVNYSVERL